MRVKELFEARDQKLHYENKEIKGKVERVIVKLEGNQSAVFTKLAKRYKALATALEKLDAEKAELNKLTKENMLDYFDAEDEVLTRVVETVSMSATMSKLAQPNPKVDHEKVIAELIKLMPELTEKVSEIAKAYTTIPKPKSPMLSVDIKEGLADVWARIKKAGSLLVSKMKSWGSSYDDKLAKIKRMMALTEALGVKMGGISTEKPIIGFKDRSNWKMSKSALTDSDINYTSRSAGGMFYIEFATMSDQKKAVKIVKSMIDSSTESEW